MGNRRRGQSGRRHVQRDVPGVVHPRASGPAGSCRRSASTGAASSRSAASSREAGSARPRACDSMFAVMLSPFILREPRIERPRPAPGPPGSAGRPRASRGPRGAGADRSRRRGQRVERGPGLRRGVVERADQADLGVVEPGGVEGDGGARRAAAEEEDLSARAHDLGKKLPHLAVSRAIHGDVGGRAGLRNQALPAFPRQVDESGAVTRGQRRPLGPPPGEDHLEAVPRRDRGPQEARERRRRTRGASPDGARSRFQPCRTEARGSRNAAVSSSRPAGSRWRFDDTTPAGTRTNSAKAPHSRSACPSAQRFPRPAAQSAHRPHGPEMPGTARSPSFHAVTPGPTSATSPESSWPMVSGGRMRGCPRASSLRSVPQVNAARIAQDHFPRPGHRPRDVPRLEVSDGGLDEGAHRRGGASRPPRDAQRFPTTSRAR